MPIAPDPPAAPEPATGTHPPTSRYRQDPGRPPDPETGELEHLTIVTDNGPAHKSDRFIRFIMARPELEHVRTRHYSPGQNGVVERFYRTLKYEHLYQMEIADAIELAEQIEVHRRLYNEVRPHESLGQVTPMSVYLDDPNLFGANSVQKS
jgi:transposase InsO family protein